MKPQQKQQSISKGQGNKELVKTIKLFLPAQNANGLTNLNAILGQAGVNAFEFGKQFNSLSSVYLKDVIINLNVLIYSDKTFDINLKLPSTAFLLYEELLKKNGINTFGEDIRYNNLKISLISLYRIAFLIKKKSNSTLSLKSHFKSLLGTVKSLNINIINDIKIKLNL